LDLSSDFAEIKGDLIFELDKESLGEMFNELKTNDINEERINSA